MRKKSKFEQVRITPESERLVHRLMEENPGLENILIDSTIESQLYASLRKWVLDCLERDSMALQYYSGHAHGRDAYLKLSWSDMAAIRILDYIDHEGRDYIDPNLRGERFINQPFRLLWLAVRYGRGGAGPAFFRDMLHLFRQFNGRAIRHLPDQEKVMEWMDRHPSGLDEEVINIRRKNKTRIINLFIKKIEAGTLTSSTFVLDPTWSRKEKYQKILEWWDNRLFHLHFAIRSPELLDEMLDHSLDPETMALLYEAKEVGIPFFINPYYLSLLDTRKHGSYIGADQAIRDYVIYSRELVDEFGHIAAWEKEDEVEPGKPNAAGWLLPDGNNVHRRYPDVAILIPDSMGRACGGLCASCQRMYDFQRGHLNFDLDRLRPGESWPQKLQRLMAYFRGDTQLRDILITGGDALMSSDKSLERILDAVYEMARQKKQDNRSRPDGEKHAEMLRVRLGTRLPAYLPQRIHEKLTQVLAGFKKKAREVGIRQFVIQTHFESAMEVTPEARHAVRQLIAAGWVVTNQQVFTAAASRRGHAARLRQVLNQIGVLPYYTFSVKGFRENYHNFATNARSVQEQIEEKHFGAISHHYYHDIARLNEQPERMAEQLHELQQRAGVPFLGTDRNVLNLPGVGKSCTFRTIGITRDGRRILEFDHDATRRHSPMIHKMGKVTIVESKSISDYLDQLVSMGEDPDDYRNLWGYSMGETEERMPLYEYPAYNFSVTDELSNFKLSEEEIS